MEKFIIEGGQPLSGTISPAGNKNAALPALAATLLTEEEVVLRNIPRIRDVEAMLDLLRGLGATRRVARRQRGGGQRLRTSTTARSTRRSRSASAPRSCWPGRCSPASAQADMPPPGGDVIGRRRLDPHLDAFRALGATRGGRPLATGSPRPQGLRAVRLLHGRAVGDGHRERAHGRRAHAGLDGDPQRGLRAPRAGPGATAPADGRARSRESARTCWSCTARAALGGADYTIAPDYIEVGSFIALAACTGGELRIKDVVADDLRMTTPGVRAARLPDRVRRRRRGRAGRPGAAREGRRGRRHLEDRGRPVARLPRRPDQHRPGAGHPGRRHGPDPREDVREPAVLRRQAGLDGRSGDRLRPAPRGRERPEPASRRAHGEPRHPRRHGHAHRRAVRRRHVGDRQHPPDRPRLRAHRRAAAGAGRSDRARRHRAAARSSRRGSRP